MDRGLKRLGQLVAKQQEPLLARDLESQSARFLAAANVPRRMSRRLWVAASLAVSVAALFALLGIRALRPQPLQLVTRGEQRTAGAWLAADQQAALPLSFSDGSVIVLGARARARVLSTDEHGAHLALERGRLDARVVHRSHASWRVDAGPYVVHVVGTAFSVDWDGAQAFRIVLREGAVRVEGPALGEGRIVRAGESLALGGAVASAPALPPVRSPEPEIGVAPAPEIGVAPPALPPDARTHNARSWRAHAQRGDHTLAFRAAIREGAFTRAERASATTLSLLADVARLSGHPSEAERCLEALRRAHPGTAEARAAAFSLGRIAFDQRASLASAQRWFDAYLREDPRGPHAREALGRALECARGLGERSLAQGYARRYLAAYADGPHARIAREQVELGP